MGKRRGEREEVKKKNSKEGRPIDKRVAYISVGN